jgi:DNA topoisomerase I
VTSAVVLQLESIRAARDAGLVYVTDCEPGIVRRRAGKGFVYLSAEGAVIRDRATIERIRAIVIPPAWSEVWICPDARGHIQATGRDARGRKQYRYHAKWREHRDEVKFQQLEEFGRSLPAIRKRIDRDLDLPGLPRHRVLAAMVRLLDSTWIRVGNDEYARANHSYGLSTLRDKHVRFSRGTVTFSFRGKGGIERVLTLEDPRLAKVVKRCQDVPGQLLFQYVDPESDLGRRRVDSGDVNDYLREISGTDFTAKYFRTWGGTLAVMCMLSDLEAPTSEREAKREIVEAIRAAARQLGNTPTVCRKYYVHPAVLEAYHDGWLRQVASNKACDNRRARAHELSPRERALMAVLKRARGGGALRLLSSARK